MKPSFFQLFHPNESLDISFLTACGHNVIVNQHQEIKRI